MSCWLVCGGGGDLVWVELVIVGIVEIGYNVGDFVKFFVDGCSE